jgi:NAD(P)-dependent dehydrogenase (short-subunit alcohol dehydrogenase family)
MSSQIAAMNTSYFDFNGARVLVTGGTSGIGHGIARGFLEVDANVIITGTRAAASDYDDVDLDGFDYRQLQMQDKAAIQALGESLEGLDILINNAGAGMPAGDEWTVEGFEASVQVNLLSAFAMTTACLEHLKASTLPGGASVLGIASLTSFFANEMVPGYGAAKAGVAQMAQTMGLSWARHGIRANAIAPGYIESRLTAPMQAMPEINDPIVARTPMQRWGTPADIAGAALFLCSEQAAFITGQTLVIDGGYTLGV